MSPTVKNDLFEKKHIFKNDKLIGFNESLIIFDIDQILSHAVFHSKINVVHVMIIKSKQHELLI